MFSYTYEHELQTRLDSDDEKSGDNDIRYDENEKYNAWDWAWDRADRTGMFTAEQCGKIADKELKKDE